MSIISGSHDRPPPPFRKEFMLEVKDAKTHFTVANTTNRRDPAFTVTGLRPGSGYVISVHSFNAKGASEARRIHAYTARYVQ